jgi:DME family drug/metabolite transporter
MRGGGIDGRLLVLASAVCFATTGTAQALGVAGASPVTVGAARIVAGAALLLLANQLLTPRTPWSDSLSWSRVLTHQPGQNRRPNAPPTWLMGRVAVGAVGVAAYQPAFFLAVHRTGVAVGTVVALGSAPVLTGALSWLTGRGRPSRGWLAATTLAGAGLTVLVLGNAIVGTSDTGLEPSGVLLALGAGASYAVYTLSTKDLLDAGMPSHTCMAAVFTGGAVLLAPLFVLLPSGWILTWRGAVEVLFLGLVPTALAYLLFARGLSSISAAETASLTLAEPLTATALGLVVLGEQLSPLAIVGAVLLFTALLALAAPTQHPVVAR